MMWWAVSQQTSGTLPHGKRGGGVSSCTRLPSNELRAQGWFGQVWVTIWNQGKDSVGRIQLIELPTFFPTLLQHFRVILSGSLTLYWGASPVLGAEFCFRTRPMVNRNDNPNRMSLTELLLQPEMSNHTQTAAPWLHLNNIPGKLFASQIIHWLKTWLLTQFNAAQNLWVIHLHVLCQEERFRTHTLCAPLTLSLNFNLQAAVALPRTWRWRRRGQTGWEADPVWTPPPSPMRRSDMSPDWGCYSGQWWSL